MSSMYLDYEDAKNLVQGMGIQTIEKYYTYAESNKLPSCIPCAPNLIYKNKGWVSWTNFLNNGKLFKGTKKDFVSFERARNFARTLNLKSSVEWLDYVRENSLPDGHPYAPRNSYRKEWTSWEDFLGYEKKQRVEFISFVEARDFARVLNVNTSTQWSKWASSGNRPSNIPSNPSQVYLKSGWLGWSDFLGKKRSNKPSEKYYFSYEEAKEYLKTKSINTKSEYKRKYGFSIEHSYYEHLPPYPELTYKDQGWVSWEDYLGTQIDK